MLLVSLVILRGGQWLDSAYVHNGLGIVGYLLVNELGQVRAKDKTLTHEQCPFGL